MAIATTAPPIQGTRSSRSRCSAAALRSAAASRARASISSASAPIATTQKATIPYARSGARNFFIPGSSAQYRRYSGVCPPKAMVRKNNPDPANSHQCRFRRAYQKPSANSTSATAPTYSECSLKPFSPWYAGNAGCPSFGSTTERPSCSGTAIPTTFTGGMEYDTEYS